MPRHTRALWIVAAALLLAVAAPVARTQSAPEDAERDAAKRAVDAADPDRVDPSAIRGPKWTLDFRFQTPEPVVLQDADGRSRVYWYVVYTVTNRTGEERVFVPRFTLFTDTATLAPAGVHPKVFAAIRRSRKIPFLENAVEVTGKVLVGEDNARTGVAIFPPLDRDADRFTIFVEGLSGQFIERPQPGAKPDAAPEDRTVRLRKTLALEYRLAGDRWWLSLDQPKFVGKKWTWR